MKRHEYAYYARRGKGSMKGWGRERKMGNVEEVRNNICWKKRKH